MCIAGARIEYFSTGHDHTVRYHTVGDPPPKPPTFLSSASVYLFPCLVFILSSTFPSNASMIL